MELHFHPLLYIDPGTGSLIAQALIAGIAAFFVFFKNGFLRFFYRKKNKISKENDENVPE